MYKDITGTELLKMLSKRFNSETSKSLFKKTHSLLTCNICGKNKIFLLEFETIAFFKVILVYGCK